MQTQTLEQAAPQILPYNEIADLIDRQVHARTLEQINFLAREYEVKNPPQVAAFLSENKLLLDLLEEIPAQIRKHFGAEQKLVLQFFLNPEDASWHQLHVLVPTKFGVDEAFARIEKFEADWWLENFGRAEMKLQVLLEYIR